jgi:hypothetical protein
MPDYYRDVSDGSRLVAACRVPFASFPRSGEVFGLGIVAQLRDWWRFLFGRFYMSPGAAPIWLVLGNAGSVKRAAEARMLHEAAKMVGGRLTLEIVLLVPAPEVKVTIEPAKAVESEPKKDEEASG